VFVSEHQDLQSRPRRPSASCAEPGTDAGHHCPLLASLRPESHYSGKVPGESSHWERSYSFVKERGPASGASPQRPPCLQVMWPSVATHFPENIDFLTISGNPFHDPQTSPGLAPNTSEQDRVRSRMEPVIAVWQTSPGLAPNTSEQDRVRSRMETCFLSKNQTCAVLRQKHSAGPTLGSPGSVLRPGEPPSPRMG